jgi:hypothetical protein
MPFLGRNFGSCKFRKFLKSDFKNRGALGALRLGWTLRCPAIVAHEARPFLNA